MQFIDTHIHLQDYKSKNAPQIPSSDIVEAVCPSVREADWPAVAALSKPIIPAFGLHPWYLAEATVGWEQRLRQMLLQNPKALIGECGLDRLKNPNAEPQKAVFAEHLRLAEELHRPLLVHAVKADAWLEDFWPQLQKVRFVLHSFGGSVEFLYRALSFGAYISFAPSIRRRANFAELAKAVPADRMLLESDGPYQGEPNEIPALAAELAVLRGVAVEDLAAQVYQNSKEFIDV